MLIEYKKFDKVSMHAMQYKKGGQNVMDQFRWLLLKVLELEFFPLYVEPVVFFSFLNIVIVTL